MINKNIILAISVIAILGVGVYFLNEKSSYNPKTQGKIIFGITDAAANMGDVSAVLITVNRVQIHSEASGWVTVSNETKQYDLLALKQSGAISLLASSTAAIGTYDQVKLMISKVIVTKNGVQIEAKLPSGELKIVGNLVVNPDRTSSMVFDFIADKSLHITGNGKLIFAPVIKIKKQNDVSILIKSNGEINITGDKEDDDEENVGMDEKGEIKNDFELKGQLDIDDDDNIRLDGGVSVKIKTDDDDDDKDDEEKNIDLKI